MSWFAAKLIFRCYINAQLDTLRESTIILVSAVTERAAIKEAKRWGDDQKCSYKNDSGEEISWKLYKVIEVQSINEEEHLDSARSGMEIWSHVYVKAPKSKKDWAEKDAKQAEVKKCQVESKD